MAKTKKKRAWPRRLERGFSYTILDAAGQPVCNITVGINRQVQAVPVGGAAIRAVTPEADDRQNGDCCGK